ncbi:hypothetical protein K2173_024435 [Erythroxylum novogranatense]|uniref:Uncharacterized protein n=1 Tax=Erythroxylum novogranatense TaxID=1862640 RepID=A0AAV8SUD6_9ROSI|nr:hypothetical protein K2173_024435 [Erythroxylum novogranatense]
MAQGGHDIPHQTPLTPTFRWPTRRRVSLRRRKPLTARLGGKKPGRGAILMRMFRRMRLRCLKLRYARMVRKLKAYYLNLVKDMKNGAATIEAYHQRLLMETSFLVPVVGVPLST